MSAEKEPGAKVSRASTMLLLAVSTVLACSSGSNDDAPAAPAGPSGPAAPSSPAGPSATPNGGDGSSPASDGGPVALSDAGTGDNPHDSGADAPDANTGPATKPAGTPAANAVVITPATVHQKIDGFGASTAWGSTLGAGDDALLWSTSSGAGLSLHRIRIDPTSGQTSEVNIAKQAVSYGVKVWATPWTPPAADKSNASLVMGNLASPTAFATYLLGFVSYMKSQGVDIYAVSAQNEPDANVTYESCAYTPAALATFVGASMGPAFAGSGVKVMSPESQNWCGFKNFEPALEANAAAWNATSIVATHE